MMELIGKPTDRERCEEMVVKWYLLNEGILQEQSSLDGWQQITSAKDKESCFSTGISNGMGGLIIENTEYGKCQSEHPFILILSEYKVSPWGTCSAGSPAVFYIIKKQPPEGDDIRAYLGAILNTDVCKAVVADWM